MILNVHNSTRQTSETIRMTLGLKVPKQLYYKYNIIEKGLGKGEKRGKTSKKCLRSYIRYYTIRRKEKKKKEKKEIYIYIYNYIYIYIIIYNYIKYIYLYIPV